MNKIKVIELLLKITVIIMQIALIINENYKLLTLIIIMLWIIIIIKEIIEMKENEENKRLLQLEKEGN